MFVCLPLLAEAATHPDFELAQDVSGNLAIRKYIGPAGEVQIPSLIDGQQVALIYSGAFQWRQDVSRVVIPPSISYIGTYVFYGCSTLKQIDVDPANSYFMSIDGVVFSRDQKELIAYPTGRTGGYVVPTGVTKIGEATFFTAAISAVEIPDSVSFLGESLFADATQLTNVRLPANLGGISAQMFLNCSNLLEVMPPKNIASIGFNAFLGCGKLRDLSLGVGVQTIGYGAFMNCASLVSIQLSPVLTTIGQDAFYGCDSLTSIDVPASVTLIGVRAFAACGNLSAINIAPGNSKYVSLEGVVYDQSRTVLLHYPGGKGGGFSIPPGVSNIGAFNQFGASIFEKASIDRLTIPASVIGIDETAFNGSRIHEFNVDALNTKFGSNAGVLFNKSQTVLLQYPLGRDGGYIIPNTVTNIRTSSFRMARGLTNVMIPASVTAIGNRAFANCDRLREIMVDPLNPAFYSEDGVLFDKMKTIVIQFPSGVGGNYTVPSGIQWVGYYSFGGNTNITGIKLAEGVSGISVEAFEGCINLSSLVLPATLHDFYASSVWDCPNLTGLYFLGDRPAVVQGPFDPIRLYYLEGKSGWIDNPFIPSELMVLWRPEDDLDQDGMTNQQEKDAWTDPMKDSSRLFLEVTLNQLGVDGIHSLRLQSVPGRTYRIETTDSVGGEWNTISTITASKSQLGLVVQNPVTASIYRVYILPE